MNDVDTLLDEDIRIQVLTGCACRYPTEDLLSIRERFLETRDMDEVIAMLQERFVMFLREEIRLPDAMVEIVVANRWGLAGEREGNTIIATKIPKSGNLQAYLEESDSEKKRALYCHCPRIRDIVNRPEPISATYCYCGGGFYKSLWEDILQESVEVELLRSVLQGDDVCSFAIHLPLEYRMITGNREGDAASW
jgi:predicted hydrocarbon binding protein